MNRETSESYESPTDSSLASNLTTRRFLDDGSHAIACHPLNMFLLPRLEMDTHPIAIKHPNLWEIDGTYVHRVLVQIQRRFR